MPPPASRGPERRAGIAILAAFAVVSVFFTGLFPRFANPNELSRFESVYAVVENGTLSIDTALKVLGDREDKAFSGGHFYSNKAPGLAFAAIPVYRALRVFFPVPHTPSAPIFVLLRLLTVTLVSGIAVAIFLRRLAPSREGPLVAFAVVFGTPFFFYARTFFSHAWTAALLFLAWDLLRKSDMSRVQSPKSKVGPASSPFPALGLRPWTLDAFSGLLAGWAAISEYTAAPLALLLALRALRGGGWKRLAPFVAASAVPLALLLFYNAACFGSPWVLSSAREARPDYAELARHGLFGFGPPNLRIAFKYLLDPARGLLWRSPVWLWLVPGFLAWRRSREERPDLLFALLAGASFFLVLTGYGNWHGGWALGNRYLLPVVFFGGLALVRALESPLSRGLFGIAAVFSAACHFLQASSWPYFPADLSFPAAEGSLWFLRHGWAAPDLLSSAGPPALAIPLLAVATAGYFSLTAARPAVPRLSVAILAALALFAATLVIAPAPSYTARLWRAGVFGGFSDLDPRREELRKVVLSAASPAEQREARGAWRTFGPR